MVPMHLFKIGFAAVLGAFVVMPLVAGRGQFLVSVRLDEFGAEESQAVQLVEHAKARVTFDTFFVLLDQEAAVGRNQIVPCLVARGSVVPELDFFVKGDGFEIGYDIAAVFGAPEFFECAGVGCGGV